MKFKIGDYVGVTKGCYLGESGYIKEKDNTLKRYKVQSSDTDFVGYFDEDYLKIMEKNNNLRKQFEIEEGSRWYNYETHIISMHYVEWLEKKLAETKDYYKPRCVKCDSILNQDMECEECKIRKISADAKCNNCRHLKDDSDHCEVTNCCFSHGRPGWEPIEDNIKQGCATCKYESNNKSECLISGCNTSNSKWEPRHELKLTNEEIEKCLMTSEKKTVTMYKWAKKINGEWTEMPTFYESTPLFIVEHNWKRLDYTATEFMKE